MLNLNDDMDDLIRQAADEYPLKMEGKDWDKVAAGIAAAGEATPANKATYWWLLLLLLPLLIAVPMYFHRGSVQQAGTLPQPPTGASTQQDIPATIADSIQQQTPVDNTSTAKNRMQQESKRNTAINTLITKTNIANDNQLPDAIKIKQASRNNHSLIDSYGSTNSRMQDTTLHSTYPNQSFVENDNTQPAQNKAEVLADVITTTQEKANTNAAADSNNVKNLATTQQETTAATTAQQNVKHTTAVKTKGVYIGVAGGLDASTIKLHKVEKIGYTTAFVLGYRLNNQWSIESGLMWDKKHYYSPGEYFDKSNTGLSADYNIHYLSGTCKMFEIPLNIKYDFKSKQLSGFFAAAGVSSYIMKNENYDYFVTHDSNPTEPGYYKQKDYSNATTNLFSVANISGGYQFIFKNNNSLRIEPYLKVPLKGLGIGKLPFSSAGVAATYTLPLH